MPPSEPQYLAAIRDELRALLETDLDASGFLDRFDAHAPYAYAALEAICASRPDSAEHVKEAFRVAAAPVILARTGLPSQFGDHRSEELSSEPLERRSIAGFGRLAASTWRSSSMAQ